MLSQLLNHPMPNLLITFAWGWFVMGMLSGAVIGLRFADDGFMGGYNGWRRRLVRLGHISFFGTGMLCLAAGLTAHATGVSLAVAGPALLVGTVAMPTVCFLSAWRKPLRHAFFIPVLGLGIGAVALTASLLQEASP